MSDADVVELPRDPIADGRRIDAFLRDPVVAFALKKLAESYIAQFTSVKPSDLLMLQSRVKAIEDFTTALMAVVQAGEIAQHTQKVQDQRAAARKQGGPR
jgi:hypothetical protein